MAATAMNAQPLSLALVTGIKYKDDTPCHSGSQNPDDILKVQYCTAGGYDKSYRPATMSLDDTKSQKLPANTPHHGVVPR